MPRQQVANTPVFDFGAPAAGARVGTAATATVTASGQVSDGDTVTLTIPAGAFGNPDALVKTFEFDGNADITEGNIGVDIGADADGSMANLEAAIAADDDLVAYLSSAVAASVVTLTARVGADGNLFDVDETGALLAVVEFSGGADAGEKVQALVFRMKDYMGGPFGGRIEADEADLAVTIQVSEDGITYTDTAVADQVVKSRAHVDVSVNLRPGKDVFVALAVTGGGRGRLLAKGSEKLEVVSL